MEEIKTYSDKTGLLVDLKLYIAQKNNQPLNLSMLPKIAGTRWVWMVRNWDLGLYKRLLSFSEGDDYLLEGLEILDNHVYAWRSGSGVNPLEDASIFADVSEHLEQISFASLSPTTSEVTYTQQELQRVASFTESNFREMLKFLKTERDKAFDYIGLGDSTYDSYRGRNSAALQREYFVTDLYVLNDAIEIEKFIEGLIFDLRTQRDTEPNLIAYANQNLLAGNSEVTAQDIFSSYFQVPFEQSLEQMARDYLGSTDLWFELVTVNKLKAPYVDLYGTKLYLTENASGNVVRVSSSEIDRYQIGSTVKVGSRVVPDEVRKVENVVDNNDGSASVSLSGSQDLAKLKVSELAFLRVFQPDTLRDFSFVKIPVSAVAPYSSLPEPTLKVLKELDKALYAFGVDLARDDITGDLILSPSGDLGIVYGINAVRSAVINTAKTELGELPLHPDYGVPQSIGFIMEGADTAVRIGSIIEKAISRDPRFTGVTVTDIIISAEGEISISMNISIAGSSQIIPLAFVV